MVGVLPQRNARFELGRYVAGRSQQYYGLMDEVRVYPKALDAKQIGEGYRKQLDRVNPR